MKKERLQEILNHIFDWGAEHEDEFMECMITASDMTIEEARELHVAEWHEDRTKEDFNLPDEEEMEIDSCLADSIEDKEYVENCISDYLSDTYGWCVNSFNYEILKDKIKITNIDWDVSM